MTLTESPPSLQFGSMLIGKKESGARQTTLEQAQEMIDVLKAHQVFQLDSARLYGDGSSEDYLGRLKVQDQGFKVSTKILPLLSTPMSTPLLKNNQYTHSAKDIHDACQASLDSLGMEKVDIYYLHLPDKKTPFAETLAAIDQEYKAGKFERFGLSNFSVEEVQEVLTLCEENSWIKPSVYQGMYNAIARSIETELLPLLRRHQISLVSYSPTAGGFFNMKEPTDLETIDPNGRFGENSHGKDTYRGIYWNEKYFNVLRRLRPLCEKSGSGIGMIEMALRWCRYHSALDGKHGDMLLLGASSPSQLEVNLKDIEKGPLPQDLVEALEESWESLKDSSFGVNPH